MSDTIGPKIQVEGEAQFKKAIAEINTSLKTMGTEMKAVTSAYDSNDKSQAKLTAQNQVLNKQIEEQKSKLDLLKAALAESAAKYGETDAKTQRWQQSVNTATADLNRMERELKNNQTAINDAGKAADDSGPRFEKFGATLKVTAAAVGAVAIAAAAAAVKMGAEVVKQFGELEQNLGGSEAVFGQYAASIQKSGEEAYKNLGLSQSDYLATANKMGALFQGSGIEQQKSLELTEKAMQRAADMASVMGIDMSMAMESVAGAAKGNFTMMDNLGVAMNATNIEAYAAGKGLDFVWNKASQAEKAEMAMQMFFESTSQYAGNFAKESTETVTGSIGLLQAALGSFTAGLGNTDADMKNLTANLVDAFNSVVKNVVPIIENLTKALPDAFGAILGAVRELLPTLLKTATSLFEQVLGAVLQLLPELIPVAVESIMTIVDALINNIDLLIEAAFTLITALADGLVKALPELVPRIVEVVTKITATIIENLPIIIGAALQIIVALAGGLISSIPQLVKAVPELIRALVSAFAGMMSQIKNIGQNIVRGIWEGITSMTSWLADKVKGFVDGIISVFTGKDGIDAHSPSRKFATFGEYMAQGIGVGFAAEMQKVAKQINDSVPTNVTMTGQYQATAKMGEGIVNGLSTALNARPGAGTYVLQVVMDSKVVAQTIFDPLQTVAMQRGVARG